jgi:hypothetical protein
MTPGNVSVVLFRSTFLRIGRAASVLRQILPPSLVGRIDWSTLQFDTATFEDEAVGERFTDLMVSVDLSGRPASMFLLFHHESDARGRLVLWHVRSDPPFLDWLHTLGYWVGLLRDVREALSREDVLVLIRRYVSSVNARFDVRESVGMLPDALFAEEKPETASAADQLREEAENKGLLRGQRKILLKLFRTRFGELPEAAMARVNAADVVQLDLWAERVLSAPTLADVLESE